MIHLRVILCVNLLTSLLTELSPSWEAAKCAATQELPSILWSPPVVRILSKIDPVHTIPSCPSKIYFNIVTQLRLCLPSGLFPYGFPTNILSAFFFSPFVLHALSISSSLTYCVWTTHKFLRYYNSCIKLYIMLQHVSAFYGCHWVKYFHSLCNLLLFSLTLANVYNWRVHNCEQLCVGSRHDPCFIAI
jgi:hypothetical protein